MMDMWVEDSLYGPFDGHIHQESHSPTHLDLTEAVPRDSRFELDSKELFRSLSDQSKTDILNRLESESYLKSNLRIVAGNTSLFVCLFVCLLSRVPGRTMISLFYNTQNFSTFTKLFYSNVIFIIVH
jgi:hypothetical protein